ncbi:MAG: sulfite exporter TauE/SafE family protein [Candidatus Kapabacteria bacterium]|nr:sulfite exporter TauE/SafE family protein [Ignavibacteriota bacterium]MCW5885326.1 sulfite exporter TauE/SafE family protein [Candidatus Kapabacteria bacterium]
MIEVGAGFALGILGSFHCLGMCGPIAIAIPHRSTTKAGVAAESLVYNFGRVATYTAMGILLGFVGAPLRLAGFQEYVSIATGFLMLLFLIIPRKYYQGVNDMRFFGKIVGRLKSKFQEFFKAKSILSLFTLGLLNGLLPCGLVYIALAGSFAADGVLTAGLYMAAFGVGTVPMMALLYFSKNLLTISLRNKLTKAIPYGVAIVAVLMILRGLSLGIPYISPKLTDQVISEQVPECCH